jgi:hypothetical protein
MIDPNLRCQVSNAMVDAQLSFFDGTCIGDITTDMADVMLSTVFFSLLVKSFEHLHPNMLRAR